MTTTGSTAKSHRPAIFHLIARQEAEEQEGWENYLVSLPDDAYQRYVDEQTERVAA